MKIKCNLTCPLARHKSVVHSGPVPHFSFSFQKKSVGGLWSFGSFIADQTVTVESEGNLLPEGKRKTATG